MGLMTANKPVPNAKQQECIDNINGKYLVLAGPGTGKTFTISERIKHMLLEGIKPDKILCLTFSESAANEMKKRIEKELDINSARVNIYTYHSFCNEIIKENPAEFGLNEHYRLIPQAVSISILKQCIDEIKPVTFKGFKNDAYVFLNTISKRISKIKTNRFTKEKYFDNIKYNPDWQPKLDNLKAELRDKTLNGKKITKKLQGDIESCEKMIAQATEVWNLYELYTDKMQQENYVDFNDMINFVLDKFENEPAFLSQIANKYEYILVDEYQDTNKNQNDIVFNLTHSQESENVFVVGDDDQIIFSFQGAKIDTIENFLREFPETKVICLNENMRSTQNILDVSRKIVKQDDARLEANPNFKQYNITKNLTAKNESLFSKNKKVRCIKFGDIVQEYNSITEEIEQLINSPDCPKDNTGNKLLSEIAILTKSNEELLTFAELLKEKNIPFELKEGKNIFEIKSVNIFYYYLKLLVNPELYSDNFFKLILSKPFNINPKDYEKLYLQKSHYPSFVDMMKSVNKDEFLKPELVEKFVSTFDYLTDYKTAETLKNVILEIGGKSGIFSYFINSEINKTENISGLKKIIDEAMDFSQTQKNNNLEDFVEYLDMCQKDDIQIKTDKAPVTMNAIQLSTYHSSKGREFEYVYMPTLLNNYWEKKRITLKPDIPLSSSEYKTEEEIRSIKFSENVKLMYVGMTRAKHTLRLSYPEYIEKDLQTPSVLISNINDILENENQNSEYDVNSYWQERAKNLQKRDYDYKRDFCSMVDARLLGKSFSPSAINTYIKCPRQYFYDYILDLGTKDGSPDAATYGSVIHSTCEFAVKYAMKNNTYPTKEDFVKHFTDEMDKAPMTDSRELNVYKERGIKALEEFYSQLCNTPTDYLYKVEEPVSFELDGVKFYGIIDRIDKNPDDTFTIYDYKTGKAKTAKSICPDGDYENYYNQIGLYKYFLEKSTGKTVKETTFIFPEDYTRNLTVEFDDDSCDLIIEKFKSTIDNIKNYEFEPNCNSDGCQWCAYKDFCDMEIV